MRLEKWALVAEILSAVAVVSSLVFVGLQVRQGAEETALNTRAMQAGAYQDLTSQLSILNTLVIDNSDLAEALWGLRSGEPPDSDLARFKLGQWMVLVYRHGEVAFVQYQNGLIDESQLRSILGPVWTTLRSEYGRQVWEGITSLGPEFRNYVNQQLVE